MALAALFVTSPVHASTEVIYQGQGTQGVNRYSITFEGCGRRHQRTFRESGIQGINFEARQLLPAGTWQYQIGSRDAMPGHYDIPNPAGGFLGGYSRLPTPQFYWGFQSLSRSGFYVARAEAAYPLIYSFACPGTPGGFLQGTMPLRWHSGMDIDLPSGRWRDRSFAYAENDVMRIFLRNYTEVTLAMTINEYSYPGPAPSVLARMYTVVSGMERPVDTVSADGVSIAHIDVESDSPEALSWSVIDDEAQMSFRGVVVQRSAPTALPGNRWRHYYSYVPPDIPARELGSGTRRAVLLTAYENGNARTQATVHLTASPTTLIHGLWSSPNTWTWFARQLQMTLGNRPDVIDYRDTNNHAFDDTGVLDSAREQLQSAFLERLSGGWLARRVDLVGHSMGGLIGAQLVQNPPDGVAIGKLLTIGTPRRGSEWAPLLQANLERPLVVGATVGDRLILGAASGITLRQVLASHGMPFGPAIASLSPQNPNLAALAPVFARPDVHVIGTDAGVLDSLLFSTVAHFLGFPTIGAVLGDGCNDLVVRCDSQLAYTSAEPLDDSVAHFRQAASESVFAAAAVQLGWPEPPQPAPIVQAPAHGIAAANNSGAQRVLDPARLNPQVQLVLPFLVQSAPVPDDDEQTTFWAAGCPNEAVDRVYFLDNQGRFLDLAGYDQLYFMRRIGTQRFAWISVCTDESWNQGAIDMVGTSQPPVDQALSTTAIALAPGERYRVRGLRLLSNGDDDELRVDAITRNGGDCMFDVVGSHTIVALAAGNCQLDVLAEGELLPLTLQILDTYADRIFKAGFE